MITDNARYKNVPAPIDLNIESRNHALKRKNDF